ncbi:hypothetical protein [Mycolicibacterium baixiangningiae]|uniref:hypothetical protein n=1 Tax=Mycolicibacterium baixiangningiae TaxID=2761578 RepID=UPI001866C052|nr:hypothetical protein [Mycolicibacterium baixiangningiae]
MKRIAMSPWDFALYSADDGSSILKVMFSEGDYKFDIGRYFLIAHPWDTKPEGLELLKSVAARIRSDYPDVVFPVLDEADLQILT